MNIRIDVIAEIQTALRDAARYRALREQLDGDCIEIADEQIYGPGSLDDFCDRSIERRQL